jgi:outer membrane protein OmpA-like peptidoglycan-associated protein
MDDTDHYKESFMKFRILGFLLVFAGMIGFVMAQAKMSDRPGYKDPDLFTRMPDFYLWSSSSFREWQFDAYDFWVRQGAKDSKQRVEGHKVQYYYYFDRSTGKPLPSGLQILRNYQNAAQKLGGKTLYENTHNGSTTTMLIVKNGLETWAEINSGDGTTYYLTIVERQAMQQDVAANAEALKDGLAQNGHVEVPGIFFDFNKADLKPESKPALDELTKFLQANPALRVWVVGHTDNIGSVDFNMALSKSRAAAVITALTMAGIAPARLAPFGNGPYAPVATNTTDEGRAKNRRVELVAQP